MTRQTLRIYHATKLGRIYHADSLDVMKTMKAGSVDLIMTSPPFGLTREKEYGNVRNRNISTGSLRASVPPCPRTRQPCD